jgi:hypothetical protein
MISGTQTLTSFQQALADERRKLEAVDRRSDELSQKKLALEQEDLADYRKLARLRVDMLATEQTQSSLDDTERLVKSFLHERQAERERIGRAIAAAETEARELNSRRQQQAAATAALAEQIDDAEKETQDRLDQDPNYIKQRDQVEQARRTAIHADTKAGKSEEELENKGQPYRDDRLFMYLWKRGYQTADYHAGNLARWLDGWVARLVKYPEARANFVRLQEIPKRLREYAQIRSQEAEAEYDKLLTLDQQAREADGISRFDEELARNQEQLADIDGEIEAAAEKMWSLEEQKAAFAAGEDSNYLKAIDFMSKELARDELGILRDDALSTPFPEDDIIIASLFDRSERKEEVGEGRRELKELRAQHEARIRELEKILIDFKKNRYDSPGTGFTDGALVTMMLANFLNGMLSRADLWRVLEQQHRYQPRRADPGFGSGGYGRGTVWGSGSQIPRGSRSSRGGFRFPSGGGGGFRFPSGGGGGFRMPRGGGGGFRTGGGF